MEEELLKKQLILNYALNGSDYSRFIDPMNNYFILKILTFYNTLKLFKPIFSMYDLIETILFNEGKKMKDLSKEEIDNYLRLTYIHLQKNECTREGYLASNWYDEFTPKWRSFSRSEKAWLFERSDQGLDISAFFLGQFTDEQSYEIYLASRDSLPAYLFADTKFHTLVMSDLRYAIKDGVDVSNFLDTSIPCENLRFLIRAKKKNIDLINYADPRTISLKCLKDIYFEQIKARS